MIVRVRYAPSPTGLQHIGGVRTALFNYFFAKSQKGKFILRVEDTDRTRYSDESLQDLFDTFKWLNISWDEGPGVEGEFGPYVQSERQDLYLEYANKLVQEGKAYYCYCSSERLEQLREQQIANKSKILGYDRACQNLTQEEREQYQAQGISPVIRFKIPETGETSFNDILLGKISRQNTDISPDPVVLKSDKMPTYHLANVIDDHFMEITHILRAQEWLSSGPLHVLLYNAFGWTPPIYCHLPMVMGEDGQKLSKRHGSTSLKDFIKDGYLPEAIINYVTMVGWAYDDSREFFTKEELEQLFSLDKISKSPGVFDYKKLQWFNGQYIRKKTDQELFDLLVPYLIEAGFVPDPLSVEEKNLVFQIIPLVKDRLRLLSEIVEIAEFFFKGPKEYEAEFLIPKKLEASDVLEIISSLKEVVLPIFDMEEKEAETYVVEEIKKSGFKMGDYLMVLRIALTGEKVSPPIIEVIQVLGKDKTLEVLNIAENKIKSLI